MTGQRRADGNVGRFRIADFPNHHDVRVLAENVAQAHRECEPDVRTHGDLVDAFEFVFDRLLNRDDAFADGIDGGKKGVERRGFAGTRRPGDEKNPVRLDDDVADGILFHLRETELVQRQENLPARQQTKRNGFAINRRHGGNADVDLLALDANVDTTVLRQALLGNVHPTHHFDTRDEGGLKTLQLRWQRNLMENAVNTVADA